MTTNADVISAAPSHQETASLSERLELFGVLSLFGVAAFLQFSIAISQLLLTFAILFWLLLIVFNRERFEAPRFFWPLVAYGTFTLISAAFSSNRIASQALPEGLDDRDAAANRGFEEKLRARPLGESGELVAVRREHRFICRDDGNSPRNYATRSTARSASRPGECAAGS